MWEDTLEAMHRLVEAGFPLNAWKLQLLVATLAVLGYVLQDSKYQLGAKALRKMFGATLPTTYRELQALMGRLNFCRDFIPDYRRKVRPILSLLGKKGGNTWG